MATRTKTRSATKSTGGEKKKGGWMKKLLLGMAGLLVAGGSAAGVVFFFYQDGMPLQEEGKPPLVEADENPFKVRPENPEGMEFAHRESAAYDAIENPEGAADEGVISLRDPPDLPTSPAFDDDPGAQADNPYQQDGNLSPEVLALLGEEEAPAETSVTVSGDGQGDMQAMTEQPEGAPVTTPNAGGAGQEAESEGTAPEKVMDSPDPVMSEMTGEAAGTAGEPAAVPAEPATAEAAVVEAKKPAAIPAEITLTKAVRIQLGSLRSKALAEREWKRLVGRHGALLGSLTLHVQQADLGARGVFYRVQAGPLDTVQAARGVCRQLESRKVGCLVVRP